MAIIETEHLGKAYPNGTRALSNLDLEVQAGTIFGFLGPNGAGKTTTVRLLNGMLTPSEGSARILGSPANDEELRKRTSTLAELAQMYDHLSAEENLRFFAALYDIAPQEADRRIKDLLVRTQLYDRRTEKLGAYSTGMKKRIYLARTLLNQPDVVFLDEPTSGLDPDAASRVNELIRKLATERGTTVFLCTHNLHLAEQVCDEFGFIKDGAMVASGTKDSLVSSMGLEPELRIRTTLGVHRRSFDNEREINGILKSIMDQGENILSVELAEPSLEDVYFHYVGRSTDELA